MAESHSQAQWQQPTSLEERLREIFVPAPLYIRYRLAKELKKGERELHLVPFLADPSRAAIDIGANKGVWTLYLARHSKHVYAFEPNPKIYRWLARYVRLPNVTTSNIALSDTEGRAELRVPKKARGFSNQHASLSPDNVTANFAAVEVETKPLDAFDLGDIGFIKIDVEGHELAVLRGGRNTIERSKPTLIIEMEERHTKRRIEDLIAEVESLGYFALVMTHHGLKSAHLLDFDKEHRNAVGTKDYVNNFIFLPSP
ncbi:MAG TPA: FkbM family methyltransferase [Alphaproteobacteria bacterium]|nr:FkbM family methyltransferase [Alphaproteobacteria bacterium]